MLRAAFRRWRQKQQHKNQISSVHPTQGSPQHLRRIPSIRPPSFSPQQQLLRCHRPTLQCRQRIDQPHITIGKPVHLSQLTQGNVLRRPVTNPVQGQQPRYAPFPAGLKQSRIIEQCLSHPRQGPASAFRHAQRRQICVCQNPGLGKTWVTPGNAEFNGVPYRATSLPANRIAATTVICCPSTARIASSSPSHAPGTRRPGRSAINRAINGSTARCR